MKPYLINSLLCTLLTSCGSAYIEPAPFQRAVEQTKAEIAFAKATLGELQIKSIRENREYCGYIGLTSDNRYFATKAQRGRKSSCLAQGVPNDIGILASYHTHGAYSDKHDSETPSADDLMADIEEGIDGYISTPAGRVWFTDARRETTNILCPKACVLADPAFKDDGDYHVEPKYTLEDLLSFED